MVPARHGKYRQWKAVSPHSQPPPAPYHNGPVLALGSDVPVRKRGIWVSEPLLAEAQDGLVLYTSITAEAAVVPRIITGNGKIRDKREADGVLFYCLNEVDTVRSFERFWEFRFGASQVLSKGKACSRFKLNEITHWRWSNLAAAFCCC